MLESENQDLLTRLTQLQKAKFELEEKVHNLYMSLKVENLLLLQVNMLEESSAAMADDLVNKSAIIEQFVKDKPGSKQMSSIQLILAFYRNVLSIH